MTITQHGVSTSLHRAFTIMTAFVLLFSLFGVSVLYAPRADAATFTVDDTADKDDGQCGGYTYSANPGNDPDCTIREAVEAAQDKSGPDVVSVPSGTYQTSVTLDLTCGDIQINGAGSGSTTIDSTITSDIDGILIRPSDCDLGPVSLSGFGIESDISAVETNVVSVENSFPEHVTMNDVKTFGTAFADVSFGFHSEINQTYDGDVSITNSQLTAGQYTNVGLGFCRQ